jgi:hypothetical protein
VTRRSCSASTPSAPGDPAPFGVAICKTLTYTCGVGLHWEDEDAAYISSRSTRYPGAVDIDPVWTQEVLEDDRLGVLEPYPNSRSERPV